MKTTPFFFMATLLLSPEILPSPENGAFDIKFPRLP